MSLVVTAANIIKLCIAALNCFLFSARFYPQESVEKALPCAAFDSFLLQAPASCTGR